MQTAVILSIPVGILGILIGLVGLCIKLIIGLSNVLLIAALLFALFLLIAIFGGLFAAIGGVLRVWEEKD